MRAVSTLSFVLLAGLLAGEPIPEDFLRGLQYRSIGPFRGGRANAVSGVRGDRRV